MGNCPDCPFIGSVTPMSAQLASRIIRYSAVTDDFNARI
jgi:hypothetical protein